LYEPKAENESKENAGELLRFVQFPTLFVKQAVLLLKEKMKLWCHIWKLYNQYTALYGVK